MIGVLSHKPFTEFNLSWRFTSPNHGAWPKLRLEKIQPLETPSARQLNEHLVAAGYDRDPHLLDFGSRYEIKDSARKRDPEVRRWLQEKRSDLKQKVFASWSPDLAVETSWGLIVQYWDDFYYPFDDLTVCDASLRWTIVFHPEDVIFFFQLDSSHET